MSFYLAMLLYACVLYISSKTEYIRDTYILNAREFFTTIACSHTSNSADVRTIIRTKCSVLAKI